MDYKAAIVTTQSIIDENKEKIDELLMKFARQVYQYRLDEKKFALKKEEAEKNNDTEKMQWLTYKETIGLISTGWYADFRHYGPQLDELEVEIEEMEELIKQFTRLDSFNESSSKA